MMPGCENFEYPSATLDLLTNLHQLWTVLYCLSQVHLGDPICSCQVGNCPAELEYPMIGTCRRAQLSHSRTDPQPARDDREPDHT